MAVCKWGTVLEYQAARHKLYAVHFWASTSCMQRTLAVEQQVDVQLRAPQELCISVGAAFAACSYVHQHINGYLMSQLSCAGPRPPGNGPPGPSGPSTSSSTTTSSTQCPHANGVWTIVSSGTYSSKATRVVSVTGETQCQGVVRAWSGFAGQRRGQSQWHCHQPGPTYSGSPVAP